ncbi:hypothetical protein [Pseudomonas protegens]|uniref:hypothetical protein n=1 Tax=Pseudomonas protegens TaxID=380021 RepID=UPI00215FD378|nr:hypothetical protein [Pseudomonas protegens]UVL73650.1 hypothetical protein LOY23_05260 [Pseudomonas protegens]
MFRPLTAWINRTHPLPERFYTQGYVDEPKDDWCVWVSIEEVAPLYLASSMNWIGLVESRQKTRDYLDSAAEIINGLEGAWLDREEREWILEKLGEPPFPSLPIYLITCSDGSDEELVYVGKTENTNRFIGGHSAALKLHAPKFSLKEKKIYRATVWFHNNDEYVSLDWVQPQTLALELLDSVESHLIYSFQPELNTAKRKQVCAKWNFYMHIQNFLDGGFLNDTFV